MTVVEVRPLAVGWSLNVSGATNAMVFQSGAAAEAAGRRLSARLAESGTPAKLVIRLRDGSIGGRFLFPPGTADTTAFRRAA